MRSDLEEELSPESGLCPVAWKLSLVSGMSSGLEAEICPVSRCPGGRSLFSVRGSSCVRVAELCNQGHAQCPRGRMTCVSDMSSGLEADLCPRSRRSTASGVCQAAWIQDYGQGRVFVQCPSGRTLYSVRGMSSVRVAELFPASCYVQYPSGRTLSCMRGISSGLDAELCPALSGMSISHTSDAGQSSSSRPLDTPLTLDRVLPPGHWTFPDAGQRSFTRTVDIPLTLDRVLPLDQGWRTFLGQRAIFSKKTFKELWACHQIILTCDY
ncbi:hypothetical protein TNCV_2886921 [Trichonephila clavipes]|nr:hypothetical protein TNCV_2886921 [Trichonephila clavipes]